jgi:hypothetical protein
MDPKNFVLDIIKAIVDSNLNEYKELFYNTTLEQSNDAHWIDALRFLNNLSIENKEIFFKIIRQIEIDTISNIFAIIDGNLWLEKQASEFVLTSKDSEISLNGELQDIFLDLINR